MHQSPPNKNHRRAQRLSRRHFVGRLGATLTVAAGSRLSVATPAESTSLRPGMMLQGNSAVELHQGARAIAGAGFESVQATFFFQPTADELKALARALKDLNLKTVAFGTYFNLFRPDDTTFMKSSRAAMRLLAAHAELFDCRQFVTWSASHAPRFDGSDPRNHTPETVAQLHRAIREVILPILEPIQGRVAFEPYYPHVLGSVELAQQVLAPFEARQVGFLVDPPNFISPALYPRREGEFHRIFRELGDHIHLAHFKDLKLNAAGTAVELPGPGGGEMNYPLFISEICRLGRPVPCIIEHIPAEPAVLTRTKAWIDEQIRLSLPARER